MHRLATIHDVTDDGDRRAQHCSISATAKFLESTESVVVPEESPRHRGPTYKCSSWDLSPWNFRGHAFCTVW